MDFIQLTKEIADSLVIFQCYNCASFDIQEIESEGQYVCRNCGVVLQELCGAGMATNYRPSHNDFHRSMDLVRLYQTAHHIVPPDFTFIRPKGWTYQAIFHFNERLAQLDCTDPAIPKSVMDRIYTQNIRYMAKCLETNTPIIYNREVIAREILGPLTWPEDLKLTKKGRPRSKTVAQTFLERWIRIRYELDGKRPPIMTIEFKKEIQSLFRLVAVAWPFCRHDEQCDAYRFWTECTADGKVVVCRHNLLNYNFIFQQLIAHMMHQNPQKYAFADGYLDYLPTLETPKRLEKLVYFWGTKLKKRTGLPYYTIRPLNLIV
ncbi:MAG: hypothetical protein QW303_01405 [Nitrososphaerota archaeon]